MAQRLQLSMAASKIIMSEGAAMNEVIDLILKGEDPLKIIEAARKVDEVEVPQLKHLRGYAAGLQEHWVEKNKKQALKELRWELGYILMELAYGEQPFTITPMERVK